MKKFNIYSIVFLLLFTHTNAKNRLLLGNHDTNISLKTIHVIESDIVLPKKKKESSYKKFERIFSDYDGTFIEDMFIYSVDIMMPDEIMQATKDVIKNRENNSYDDSKEFLKMFSNDAYNIFLTTGYYYIQDISRITQRIWNKAVCSPDTFKYETDKEPKQVFLALKMSDEATRGITRQGIVLPLNSNFPDAQYPYASKPNGCSTEELEYVYDLSNTFSNDDKWLNKACDEHDKCYYTEGTTYKECNAKFIVNTIDSCNDITGRNTLLFMGTKNAFCGIKALTVSTGANSCAEKYFEKAQRRQKEYNAWVLRYEKAYLEANRKNRQKVQIDGTTI
jgi:hypothetical protein